MPDASMLLPPHDLAAEAAVLGSLILEGEMLPGVDHLRSADFWSQPHAWVYEACQLVAERREGVTQITVAHELAMADRLESIGGLAFLNTLVGGTPTSVYAEHYAAIVAKCATLRRLQDAAGQIAALAQNAPDAEAALAAAEEALAGVRSGLPAPTSRSLGDLICDILAGPDGGDAVVGTGFRRLDLLLGGFRAGDLVIIAARPGIGKSALARIRE